VHFNSYSLRLTFDIDLRYAGSLQSLAHIPPEHEVFLEQFGKIFFGKPV
jgi:hypothetical protein